MHHQLESNPMDWNSYDFSPKEAYAFVEEKKDCGPRKDFDVKDEPD